MERWLEPLYDAEAMRAVDSWAIEGAGVPSLELMETAGRALAEVAERHATGGPVRVVCGKGNNGGDGLVAARHLAGAGHEVEVLLLWPAAELSPDATANLDRFDGEVRELAVGEAEAALAGSGVVIDAIFGTGFSGAPRDPAAAAIDAINECGAPVVAADVASGVDASTGEVEGAAIERRGDGQLPRREARTLDCAGQAPHGRARGGADRDPGRCARPAQRWPHPHLGARSAGRPRTADSTKFTSGQVLVAGGSRGLTGAPCMASDRGHPGRGGLRDRRRSGGARADLRGEADRGDVGRLPERRRRLSAPRPPTPIISRRGARGGGRARPRDRPRGAGRRAGRRAARRGSRRRSSSTPTASTPSPGGSS